MNSWPVLASASVAMMTASLRIVTHGGDLLAVSCLTAGLILLGVWIAGEARR